MRALFVAATLALAHSVSEGARSAAGGSLDAAVSSRTSYDSEAPMFCGPHNFCMQRANNRIYCFGSNGGCLWGRNDCSSDDDCKKYNGDSSKFADGWSCSGAPRKHWSISACPSSDTGSMVCSPHRICVQKVHSVVYCYGSDDGCLWGRGDCNTDADCSNKYSFAKARKYTDNAGACRGVGRGDERRSLHPH